MTDSPPIRKKYPYYLVRTFLMGLRVFLRADTVIAFFSSGVPPPTKN